MNLFDILGPVMVGPSSSHTAGTVRLGRTARRLLGEGTPREAAITLFGSFAATGHGHGTDRALIAGLLGFQPDDERIARSFDIARDAGTQLTGGAEPPACLARHLDRNELGRKSGQGFYRCCIRLSLRSCLSGWLFQCHRYTSLINARISSAACELPPSSTDLPDGIASLYAFR